MSQRQQHQQGWDTPLEPGGGVRPPWSSRMGRRSLLLATTSLFLTHAVSGCLGPRSPQFVVEFLASSIPATLLKLFQAEIQESATLKLNPIQQLSEGALNTLSASDSANTAPSEPSSISRWIPGLNRSAPVQTPVPDVVSLSDSWLAQAIQAEQLTPLSLAQHSGWTALPAEFQQLVTRNAQGHLSQTGQIWAAPYRWGHLMIAYRGEETAAVGWNPKDWEDLLDERIQGHLSLLDHERIAIGIGLKLLGQSVNTEPLDQVEELTERLSRLHQQVKLYSSDAYLQPLMLKDTWVAVGWSMDILPIVRRDRRIKAIVPASGSILTADVWVHPRKSATQDDSSLSASSSPQPSNSTNAQPNQTDENTPKNQDKLLNRWIDFFWEPNIATQLSLLSPGASPTLLNPDRATDLPAALTEDTLLIPPADILNASEFLTPLPDAAIALYHRYWTEMRKG